MVKILVSACLLGERVRYDGRIVVFESPILADWRDREWVLPFCPETAGGLPVPRLPCEISGGGGEDALNGSADITDHSGENLTCAFLSGAEKALRAAQASNVAFALLKERSPSCGSRRIHDGTFTGTLREGSGVLAVLLEKNGIPVFGEDRIFEAAAYLKKIALQSD